MPDLRSFEEHTRDFIRRLRSYAPTLTWFGPNGVGTGIARAVAGLAYRADRQVAQLQQRYNLLQAVDDNLDIVAAEWGATRRAGQRARTLGSPIALSAVVSDITGVLIEVPSGEGSAFSTLGAVTLVNGDGTVTETAGLIAVFTGTGPNGGDQIEVNLISALYSPTTDVVTVLASVTIPAGTIITTTAGVDFITLDAVLTGARNPVLAGASSALSLADVVWCEAVERGAAGNVEADTFEDSNPTIDGVTGWVNYEAARQGLDREAAADLRYRAAHGTQEPAQETRAWFEALAHRASSTVLRAVVGDTANLRSMALGVLKANASAFTADELANIKAYVEDRVRSGLLVEVATITLDAVEVKARITLEPNVDLRDVFREVSARLANYLDFRVWQEGESVDEAELIAIVRRTPGVRGLETSTFTPAANVDVTYYPHLTRVALTDVLTGDSIDILLNQGF